MGLPLCFLADALVSSHTNPPIQAEIPTLKTIEVSLKSVPSQAAANNQNDAAIAPKTAAGVQPNLKKQVSAKLAKPKPAPKLASLRKNLIENKTNKLANNTILNDLKPKSPAKPDLLVSKKSHQDNWANSRSAAPTTSKPSNSNTALSAQTWQQPISNSANSLADKSQPGLPKPRLMPAKLSNYSSGISSALPPLMKSRLPDYPEEARWEERTGKTTVKFKISGQGRVLEPSVSKSSGHRDLDLAAIKAIQFWHFKTAS